VRYAAIPDDDAVADFDDTVRLRRDLLVMSDDDHRMAERVELAQNPDDIAAALAVERAGRFVGENDLAAVHQCAGDAHALLLAT
jgi:hypothetical protein